MFARHSREISMSQRRLNGLRVSDPRFLLMYSALQFGPLEMAKPDGSLSLPYVAGSLRRAQYDVDILDVSVGKPEDRLEDTFLKPTVLPSGLRRCGISLERVGEIMNDYDVIGISSIFTTQTTMVMELTEFAKATSPEKLIIAGGVNARNMRRRFFDAGVGIIALSESEETILAIARALQGKGKMTDVPGIAYRDDTGREIVNPVGRITEDLDDLPLPAWDLQPLDKYWDLSRPHGGQFPPGQRI